MKDECSGVKCYREYYLIYLTVPLCKRHWHKFCDIKEKEWTKEWKKKVKKLIGSSSYEKIRTVYRENKKVREYMKAIETKNKKEKKNKRISKRTDKGNTKSVDSKRIKRK